MRSLLLRGPALVLLGTGLATADTLTNQSFNTDFEPASGYALGQLAPDTVFPFTGNQPMAGTDTPQWEQKWLPGFNAGAVDVTDARAHSGAQAITFTGTSAGGVDVISQVQHIGMLDGSVEAGPLVWIERFSIYVPSDVADPRVLRVEPSNNFPGQGYAYQLSLLAMASGNFRPELQNAGAVFNDLRDELGKPEGFEPDKWWNVTIVADGAAAAITGVAISDDAGASYANMALNEPFGLGTASRPERLNYFGAEGVSLDDISVVPEPAAALLMVVLGLGARRRA